MNSESLISLLSLLKVDEFSSGQWLGAQLGITRAAIWKQLRLLEELGVDVESVKGKGYRLMQPLVLVDSDKVNGMLPLAIKNTVHIQSLLSTDSTNDTVKKHFLSHRRMNVCVADHQTAGRGRRGRIWESPLGSNCYYSLLWNTEQGFSALEGLSLTVGLVLIETLESLGVKDLSLKWPNDVLWRGKKLAGVLVEVEGDANGYCDVVIGVGINLFLPDRVCEKIQQPVIDLHRILNRIPDKNKLVARLTECMVKSLVRFESKGFACFQKAWNERDAFRGDTVTLYVGGRECHGVCSGVDNKGCLLLKTEEGIKRFSGGEVSVRSNAGEMKENS